ncbi:cytochrome c biogenesis protein CcdA [Nocardioides sp.]|uniref:cytochrome c biogenesis CcdA family protein n=1 Tax=Nocardioides sp. TaxID=35761 RepID=UPI000C89C63E|nr:cytochrome c biogenesis protein CcdA [Nocardioides sp.]MAS54907.1 cytochrome C biogenesis protein ResC [Pimelobacter sp.]MDE0776572.1 cytochrome c biogenesis protein CcdA [Nocardioides sp.]
MVEWFQTQAAGGSLALAVPVAAVAGLVSFFSPCVIPLLPGYLSYATGLSGADLATGEAGRRRGRMLAGSVLFVLGFAVVFVLIGATVGGVGSWLREYRDEITVVMGALLIVLGLVFAGVFTRVLPGLQRDWRIHSIPSVGLGAAPLIGALFALGWSPCIGPTYSVIVGLTYTDATAGRGALLSAVYALGLGIPFVLAGVFYSRSLGAISWVRRRQQLVMLIGGAMLVVVGVLLVTGWWDWIVQWLQLQLVDGFEVAI